MATTIASVIKQLENLAHPSLQESYDNAGLIAGDPQETCTGILCALDLTESVVDEALVAGVNLIVTHHPVLFRPLKSLSPQSPVERCLIKAIRHQISLYAIHTNYDNVYHGVNLALAKKIGLSPNSLHILFPMTGKLEKLFTYVPLSHAEMVKNALFAAGAGNIGQYRECSFSTEGTGTFTPLEGSNPFAGSIGVREAAAEVKLEVILEAWQRKAVLEALRSSHPYEEIAYEIIKTENAYPLIGAGMVGILPEPMTPTAFLGHLKSALGLSVIRHSPIPGQKISKVALCGGAGAFLIQKARQAGAEAFLTADLKYHDFFEPGLNMLLADIGHYESEIPAIAQLVVYLQEKFPTFAVLQTKVDTNPVHYFAG